MTLRSLAGLGALATCLFASGCIIDPFCINCGDRGSKADGGSDGPDFPDRPPIGECTYVGEEICNGADDDCDGEIDEGDLPQVGETCGTEEGACHPGVSACIDGAIACAGNDYVAAGPEQCNGIDDDCDGEVDDGLMRECGTSVGACTRGTQSCAGGVWGACSGVIPSTEVCTQDADGYAVDDDCDGTLDEGNPGGGALCGSGADACTSGYLRCTGGELVCTFATGPSPESCDNIDNDCDGDVDNGFDFETDPRHCGDCSTECNAPHARNECVNYACQFTECDDGWFDVDPDDPGCEYECEYFGAESCNGRDDDCNGELNDGLVAPEALCANVGECAERVMSCDPSDGWLCNYPDSVSTDSSGDIVPETDCDDEDDDCNDIVDDVYFDRKGDVCTLGVGRCQVTGLWECNGDEDGIECIPDVEALDPIDETCNGVDDDCDGEIDEGAPDDWVPVTGAYGNVLIYRYEASRPDATSTTRGVLSHRSCSTANRLPWVSVTYAQAEAACLHAGGRLCSEGEWQEACETTADPACEWSFASACTEYQETTCNGNSVDSDPDTFGDQDAVAATGSFPDCYTHWGLDAEGIPQRVFDLSGNVREWTSPGPDRPPGAYPCRGGAYDTVPGGMRCSSDFRLADDTSSLPTVGFRCCKSL